MKEGDEVKVKNIKPGEVITSMGVWQDTFTDQMALLSGKVFTVKERNFDWYVLEGEAFNFHESWLTANTTPV